ncbi:MAG: acyl-CoA dehydrogenase family protein, partial [Dehalococcoidia bacterium]
MDQVIYFEEMAYYGAPVAYHLTGDRQIGPILIMFGSEEQKREFLPRIVRAEISFGQAFSEPGAGSDLASLQMGAEERDDGFILNGQKLWVGRGHLVDWCFALARTDPGSQRHRGISAFLVDMRTPGISARPRPNIIADIALSEIFFDNVRVPRENLVGEENGGWGVAMAMLNIERTGIERVGICRRVLDELAAFARRAGRANEPVRQKLAEMAIEIEVLRWLCYRVAWLQAQGLGPEAEASVAKVFGSELMQRMAQGGMQLLGLYGQLEGGHLLAPLSGMIERWYLSTLGYTLAQGTSEVQRNIIATRGLGLPRG